MNNKCIGEEIAPGLYLLEPVEIDPKLAAEFLDGMSLESKLLLGRGNDKKRQKRRIRIALARCRKRAEELGL